MLHCLHYLYILILTLNLPNGNMFYNAVPITLHFFQANKKKHYAKLLVLNLTTTFFLNIASMVNLISEKSTSVYNINTFMSVRVK